MPYIIKSVTSTTTRQHLWTHLTDTAPFWLTWSISKKLRGKLFIAVGKALPSPWTQLYALSSLLPVSSSLPVPHVFHAQIWRSRSTSRPSHTHDNNRIIRHTLAHMKLPVHVLGLIYANLLSLSVCLSVCLSLSLSLSILTALFQVDLG